jgi:hypothetical protein
MKIIIVVINSTAAVVIISKLYVSLTFVQKFVYCSNCSLHCIFYSASYITNLLHSLFYQIVYLDFIAHMIYSSRALLPVTSASLRNNKHTAASDIFFFLFIVGSVFSFLLWRGWLGGADMD